MTVADFLAFTKRHWLILVAGLVIGVLCGGAYAMIAPKSYQASASGFVAAQGSNVFSGTEAAVNRATSYLPLIDSKAVRDKIAATAGVDADGLAGRLSATIPPGATLIEVTATAPEPQAAATLASGALNALAEVITEIETQVTEGAETPSGIIVVPMDDAVVPTSPASPDMKLAIGIGALAGLVLGYLIALVRMISDVRVRTGTELSELSGAGLLGRIPRVSGRNGAEGLEDRAGESLRQIRTGLRFASVDDKVRSIVITSAHQGDGKTTIAVALARMIARSGQSTILIDADLRRPRLAEEMGIDGSVGLSQVLSGQAELLDVLRRTSSPHLVVLPAGGIPPNPSEMLGSKTMKRLLDELPLDCIVIIDAPPVLPVTDALLIGSAADGVVVVASSGKTHKTDVSAMRDLLDQAKVHVLGCILNRVPAREAADGYSYRRQYKSYYTENSHSEAVASAPQRTSTPTPEPVPGPVRTPPSAEPADDLDDAFSALLADSAAPPVPTSGRSNRRRSY